MDESQYPPEYLRGIELFNACDFFESHEAWEEIWQEVRDESRKFYQGLIQAAVALHHFGNGNLRGAKKTYYGSCSYLEAYRPRFLGLDLEKFLADMHACFAPLIAAADESSGVELIVERIPEIHLQPRAQ